MVGGGRIKVTGLSCGNYLQFGAFCVYNCHPACLSLHMSVVVGPERHLNLCLIRKTD